MQSQQKTGELALASSFQKSKENIKKISVVVPGKRKKIETHARKQFSYKKNFHELHTSTPMLAVAIKLAK